MIDKIQIASDLFNQILYNEEHMNYFSEEQKKKFFDEYFLFVQLIADSDLDELFAEHANPELTDQAALSFCYELRCLYKKFFNFTCENYDPNNQVVHFLFNQRVITEVETDLVDAYIRENEILLGKRAYDMLVGNISKYVNPLNKEMAFRDDIATYETIIVPICDRFMKED